jgi:bifunctional DNA-binding transcriptional regulator/antitoxin component of YhaV-PrlF toxin-antitoxin module
MFRLVLSPLVVVAGIRAQAHAQSNVYSMSIYAGGTSYQVLCAFDIPFPPYHDKITQRSRFEDADGLVKGSNGLDKVASTPRPRHTNGMKTTVELDASNRIVLSRELRRAAGIARRQKLIVSATPGRIVLEMEPNASGRIIKRGKLKVWTGTVPTTPIEEAVNQARHYSR